MYVLHQDNHILLCSHIVQGYREVGDDAAYVLTMAHSLTQDPDIVRRIGKSGSREGRFSEPDGIVHRGIVIGQHLESQHVKGGFVHVVNPVEDILPVHRLAILPTGLFSGHMNGQTGAFDKRQCLQ